MLGTIRAPAPQSCLVVKTRRASWAQGRGWGLGGGVLCQRHKHPTPGGGGGGGSKSRPPCFLVPKGGPAHGLHPRFVVAEIWADWVQGVGGARS